MSAQRLHDLAERIAERRMEQTDPSDYISYRDQLREILERTGLTAAQEAQLHLLEEACDA